MVEAARIIAVPGIGAPPAIAVAIARVGIARSVVLAIGIGIELGTPARIVDDVLGRCRRGKREQQEGGNSCEFGHGGLLDLGSPVSETSARSASWFHRNSRGSGATPGTLLSDDRIT